MLINLPIKFQPTKIQYQKIKNLLLKPILN